MHSDGVVNSRPRVSMELPADGSESTDCDAPTTSTVLDKAKSPEEDAAMPESVVLRAELERAETRIAELRQQKRVIDAEKAEIEQKERRAQEEITAMENIAQLLRGVLARPMAHRCSTKDLGRDWCTRAQHRKRQFLKEFLPRVFFVPVPNGIMYLLRSRKWRESVAAWCLKRTFYSGASWCLKRTFYSGASMLVLLVMSKPRRSL